LKNQQTASLKVHHKITVLILYKFHYQSFLQQSGHVAVGD